MKQWPAQRVGEQVSEQLLLVDLRRGAGEAYLLAPSGPEGAHRLFGGDDEVVGDLLCGRWFARGLGPLAVAEKHLDEARSQAGSAEAGGPAHRRARLCGCLVDLRARRCSALGDLLSERTLRMRCPQLTRSWRCRSGRHDGFSHLVQRSRRCRASLVSMRKAQHQVLHVRAPSRIVLGVGVVAGQNYGGARPLRASSRHTFARHEFAVYSLWIRARRRKTQSRSSSQSLTCDRSTRQNVTCVPRSPLR